VVKSVLREGCAMRVTVFAGSSAGGRPEYADAAADVGRLLAEAGIGVVYGGGGVGLMGVMAGAAMSAGGEVIGVIPQALVEAEVADLEVTRLEVVDSMHTRKARMAELCDAFVALPGGLGTLEELFEVLTWRQLRLHNKSVALLDVAGFWDPLLAFIDEQVSDGFVPARSRAGLLRVTDPRELLTVLRMT
jgi:uncharacterized protein (TIGR00730 family)